MRKCQVCKKLFVVTGATWWNKEHRKYCSRKCLRRRSNKKYWTKYYPKNKSNIITKNTIWMKTKGKLYYLKNRSSILAKAKLWRENNRLK